MPLFLKPLYHVELIVEGRKHFYEVTGDSEELLGRFGGVTGHLDIISKPALIGWSRNEALASVEKALRNHLNEFRPINFDEAWIEGIIKEAKARPDKIKDDAADLGTQVHAVIDLIIHGKEPENVAPEIQGPVQTFKEWWRNSGIELVMGDTKVASLKYKFGGSLDALGRRNGKFIVLDWKTSSGIWKEYSLQASAYCAAFAETYGIYCQEAIIVRFDKRPFSVFDPKKDIKEVENLERSFQGFLAAKALKECLDLGQYKEVA